MSSALPTFVPVLGDLVTLLDQNLVKREASRTFTLLERQTLGMIHRVIFGFSKTFMASMCRTRRVHWRTPIQHQFAVSSIKWTMQQQETRDLRIGYFGSSTGGPAALVAAAELSQGAGAIVSCGGRPDLAGDACQKCKHRHCSSSAATMTLSSS